MSAHLVPPASLDEHLVYAITPRPKRSFNTVLDAHDLLPPGRAYRATVRTRVVTAEGARRVELELSQEHRHGLIDERLVCDAQPSLRARLFERTLTDAAGREARRERVDFSLPALPLPADAFPEVSLPFLLRFQPFDRERRSVHAWICDRMVARVYVEVTGTRTVTVPAGRFEVTEVAMYPDLNDWVKLPRMVSELSRPLLPRYHMAYETRAPHRLVRFEGPHGPPGAPEVILELSQG